MAALIATYTARDPLAFIRTFNDFEAVRAELGSTGHRLFRGGLDDDEFVAVINFSSLGEVDSFASDPRRAEALERAGVVESHDILVEELDSSGSVAPAGATR